MMVENKSTIFGIIALIIGATGLGLGAFSVISLQAVEGEQGLPGEDGTDGIDGIDGTDGIEGINGTDGIDGIDGIDAPGYFCSSAAEVQQALDSIGNDSGKIIINESITLTSTININGGGSYIIQGQKPGITINCSGDWSAFDVTNATSCIIKDLKIDSSDIIISTRSIIYINEINNNPVYIEKIQITGDSDLTGRGITIGSENVWISDCYFNKINEGIYQFSGGEGHISDNIILDCGIYGIRLYGDYNYISGNKLDTGPESGISIFGSYNMIVDNYITEFTYGIRVFEGDNTIKDNTFHSLENDGIYLSDYFSSCDNNLISGNYISEVGFTGIYLDTCYFTIISENHISRFGSYGIYLENCTSNIISGNSISDGEDNGIYLYYNSDYNVISGNSISNINRTGDFAGILLSIDADFNTINGNGIFNCISYGGGTGYGIRIWEYLLFECNNNTVIGNTALNNDFNWLDGGTDTFGNETYNNFS